MNGNIQKTTIEIIVKDWSGRSVYREKREIYPSDYIKPLALEAINKAIKTGTAKDWTQEIDQNHPLEISLGNSTGDYTINYDIDDTGEIIFLNDIYDRLEHDWKYKDITTLVSEQYISGNPSIIIATIPEGLGGLGDILGDVLIGLIANWLYDIFIKYSPIIVNKFKKSRAKEIATKWANNNLGYPSELREFVEKRAEWSIDDISIRLGINKDESTALLQMLGYEQVANGNYRISRSQKSIQRHHTWLAKEENFAKQAQKSIDLILEVKNSSFNSKTNTSTD